MNRETTEALAFVALLFVGTMSCGLATLALAALFGVP